MALFGKDIGIDLGTVNVLVSEDGEIVLHEPCVVAIRVDEQKIVSIGQEAREMFGRSPESIEVMRPIQDGVIADYEVTERMLHYFLTKVCGPMRLFKPRVMLSVPYGATSVESRAVHEAAKEAGSREAFLIQEPLAAAIGAGLPVGTPAGNMALDIGGGNTECAIVALNGIVIADSARVGGMALDQAIVTYVRKKYGIVIGEITAEEIKIRIGSAVPLDEVLAVEIQGRDHITGLPRDAIITSEDVSEAIDEPLEDIIAVAKSVLEKTPPELASDAIDRGIVLCGGGSYLRGIEKRISSSVGVPAYLTDNPIGCVAVGASRALDLYEVMQPHLPRI
mgnify:FL=1